MTEASRVAVPIRVEVYNQERKKVSELELDPGIFGVEVKPHLLHSVVVWQEAGHRQGTAKVKTRAEVSGTGKKPWRQKGTGRSRHGSLRSPLWPGGGKVFGPRPRDYSWTLPKKIKKSALRMALSLKLRAGEMLVLDKIELNEIKTKKFKELLKNLGLSNGLLVIGESNPKVEKSARNLEDIKVLRVDGINVRDILSHKNLVLEVPAVNKLLERLR